jgi:hypothetical protein
MSTEITINQDIVEINVDETVVVIEAPSGAYPLPTGVFSVFGRTGNVLAAEGDYSLNLLGDVTLTSPSNGQVLKYNGTAWVNGLDNNAVTSVFGRTGAITAQSGDYNTLQVTENTNLYFTDQRARFAISGDATSGVVYQNTTGIIALDDIPNTSLLNSSVTVNGSTVALGGSTSFTTTAVTEGTNLYYTDARARAAITGTAPISVTSGVVSISQANSTTNGFLSSTDWTTFNAKQSALTLGNLTSSDITVTGGTGAVVGSGSTLTLATVNSNVGQFGSSTAIPVITVNGKGLVTAMSTTAVSIPSGALNFIGDVTGSGTTGSDTTLTLATVNSNVGSYGNSVTVPTITVNAKGLVTSASQTAIPTATSSVTGLLSSTDWSTFNGKQAQLNGTGFVKVSGTTVSYDNSTYLTTIEGITAGGELSGTYASPSLVNSAVTGKVLTGLNVTGGSLSATDSILAAFGKVQNQINGLIGGSIYQGTWNASTNTPALASGVGTKGYYYIVSVAGTTNLDGITDWNVGDWAIYDGTAWQQVDNTDAVVSVNGFTGAVSLTTSNITEGTNLYYTDARARDSVSAGTAISYNSTTGVITNSAPDQTVSLTASTGISTSGTYPSFTITNTAPDQTVSLTSGTGISATGTYPNFTITNTAPDQTVSLTGAGTTSISGTYPNFTITSNDQYVGTVTSVSASLPISSTGGATPTLSITQANTSTDGYLSSTDWNTFNNKVSSATLAGYVPYTGATTNVNLGTHSLTAADLVVNHTSGSGVAASITKGGNGEALTVVKSSGSGNAASITGGVTLLDELHLTTDLADTYIASATTWNAKQNAITLTTTGNSGASTFVSNTLNIPTYTLAGLGGINLTSLSATSPLLYDNTTGVFSIQQASGSQAGFLAAADWTTFNGKIGGSGTTNYVPKFSASGVIGNSSIQDNGTTITLGLALSGTNATFSGQLAIGGQSNIYAGLSGLYAIQNGNSSYYSYDQESGIVANGYYDGGWKYKTTNRATRYIANIGTHTFEYAVSGTANAALTWLPALTIANNGNVGIGTSTFNYSSAGRGDLAVNGTTDSILELQANSATIAYLYAGTSNVDLRAFSSRDLTFSTTGGERMRITSAGNVRIVGGGDLEIYPLSGSSYTAMYNDNDNFSIWNNGSERIRITADGLNTYIGKNATGNFQLSVDGFGNYVFNNAIAGGYRNYLNYALATYMITSNAGNTGMFMSSGGSSWNVFSSDVRVKKNFEPSQGLAELLQIEPIKYHMKTDSDDAPKRLGFKAQNLLPLIPEMVTTNPMALDENGKPYYTITPDYLLPVLVKAIQELKAEIDQLKNK